MRQLLHPHALFSFQNTLTRGEFIRMYIFLLVINLVSDIFGHMAEKIFILEWFFWSLFSLSAILIYFQMIKRLHDTNHSGWYSLFLFVPFVNLYIIYLLFFKASKHA